MITEDIGKTIINAQEEIKALRNRLEKMNES